MNVRQIALELLDRHELEGTYINLALSSSRVKGLEAAERSFLTALLYGTVERKLTYDYYICSLAGRGLDKIDIHTLNILRLGMHQILEMHSLPDFAAVNETVSLGRSKGERSFVNGLLRALIRARDADSLPVPKREKNAARYLSVKHSFPLWICKHFINILGEEAAQRLLISFNSQNYTDITVNTARVTREELAARLGTSDRQVEISTRTAHGIRIHGSVDPTTLDGFDDGLFLVQDEACLISAEALGVREGDRVIDVCACPGGKSFAAAIAAGGSADVLSLDIHQSKLSLISEGAKRLGIDSIRAEIQDATCPRVELFGQFDRVICDVPCSGLGVLGKKSDIRYKSDEGIGELPALQYDILSKSASYLKSGGALVYSTCTLNPAENEEIIARFLREHPDMQPIDFCAGELSSTGGMLTLMPHVHKTDGFFIARLGKK